MDLDQDLTRRNLNTMHLPQSPFRRGQNYIFISYRSLDVQLVRPCIEAWVARGVSVWFAEYEILLANRSTFRDMFLRGAAECERAIAFTSTAYWNSDHTCAELLALLDQGKEILDIQLRESDADDIKSPEARALFERFQARSARRLEYFRNPDPALLHEFVNNSFDFNLDRCPSRTSKGSRTHEFFLGGRDSFAIDVGAWSIIDERHSKGLDIRPSGEDPKVKGRWSLSDQQPDYSDGIPESAGLDCSVLLRHERNGAPMELSVFGGPWSSNESFESVDFDDDRQAFDALARIASDYLTLEMSGEFQCLGAHLFLVDRRGHLAFTYSSEARDCWSRKYVIRANPSGQETELAFTLKVNGSLQDFLESVHVADEVVMSLHWNPTSIEIHGDRSPYVRLFYTLPPVIIGIVFYVLVAVPIDLPALAAIALTAVFTLGTAGTLYPIIKKFIDR